MVSIFMGYLTCVCWKAKYASEGEVIGISVDERRPTRMNLGQLTDRSSPGSVLEGQTRQYSCLDRLTAVHLHHQQWIEAPLVNVSNWTLVIQVSPTFLNGQSRE